MNAYRLHHNRSSGGAATMFDDLDSIELWNRRAYLFAPFIAWLARQAPLLTLHGKLFKV